MSDFGFGEQLERASVADDYFAWIADVFRPFVGQRILDIGCGIGTMIEHWVDRELVVGVDTEAACVARSRQRFDGRANVRIDELHVGAPGWIERLAQDRFDTLTAVNVLEHIRDDLEALRGWRRVLEASGGGNLCVFVPAFELAYSSFDRRYGHYRRYTKETLRDRMLEAGFDLEELRYFNMPGLVLWWLFFVVMRRDEVKTTEVSLYNKIFIPLARRLEKIVTPPFGNSIIAVGRVAAK
jgi:SAM-dependent methyltransferase